LTRTTTIDLDRPAAPRLFQGLTVELVGPAGAGKTAALRSLGRREPGVRIGLRAPRRSYLAVALRHAGEFVPAGIDLVVQDRQRWRSGMRHLLRITALHHSLPGASSPSRPTVIIDEGPVFSLGRLLAFHPATRGGGAMARAWQLALDRWARVLDVVFWLDAPNASLAERIRKRAKAHSVKCGTDQEVAEFLDRYRAAYQDVLDRLAAAGRVRVISIETSASTIEETADRILAVLNQLHGLSAGGEAEGRMSQCRE
jgi:shikimate kinase